MEHSDGMEVSSEKRTKTDNTLYQATTSRSLRLSKPSSSKQCNRDATNLNSKSETKFGVLTLVTQIPGVSIYHGTKLSNLVVILPKPLTSAELKELKVEYSRLRTIRVPIHCGACDRTLQKVSFTELVKKFPHARWHKYMCTLCGFRDNEHSFVEEHVWDHILSKYKFCDECRLQDESSSKTKCPVEEEKENVSTEQSSLPISVIKCQKCDTNLGEESSLVNKLTKTIRLSGRRCNYCCEICSSEFSRKIECQNHILKSMKSTLIFCSHCHPKKAYIDNYLLSTSQEVTESSSENGCEKSSTSNKREVLEANEPFCYSCEMCKRIFKDEHSFLSNWTNEVEVQYVANEQILVSSLVKYKCKFCKMAYNINQQEELKKHLSFHGRKVKECSECPKRKEKKK